LFFPLGKSGTAVGRDTITRDKEDDDEKSGKKEKGSAVSETYFPFQRREMRSEDEKRETPEKKNGNLNRRRGRKLRLQ
jgi:hypothetical protein